MLHIPKSERILYTLGQKKTKLKTKPIGMLTGSDPQDNKNVNITIRTWTPWQKQFYLSSFQYWYWRCVLTSVNIIIMSKSYCFLLWTDWYELRNFPIFAGCFPFYVFKIVLFGELALLFRPTLFFPINVCFFFEMCITLSLLLINPVLVESQANKYTHIWCYKLSHYFWRTIWKYIINSKNSEKIKCSMKLGTK